MQDTSRAYDSAQLYAVGAYEPCRAYSSKLDSIRDWGTWLIDVYWDLTIVLIKNLMENSLFPELTANKQLEGIKGEYKFI